MSSHLFDPPTLEELSGWARDEDSNPPLVTESDMHVEDDVAYEDAEEENRRDYARCLRGCPHFGRCSNWEGM